MRLVTGLWLGVLFLPLAACDRRPEPASAQVTSGSFTPDSTRQAQLTAFRQGTMEVHDLQGGYPSREELVRAFLEALEAQDTASLRHLVIDRAEFGWIYYPTNPQAGPPYDLDPGMFWFMTSQRSAKGLGTARAAVGGKRLQYAGHSCDTTVSREGENTVYGPCLIRLVQAPGDTAQLRMFSLVIERHGRWKIVSYANKLD
jgi:hypothetical protein